MTFWIVRYTEKPFQNGVYCGLFKSTSHQRGADILIDAGTWSFTLEAYKDSVKRYYASLENVVIVGGENPVSFSLVEAEPKGTGGFSVSLSFPDDALVATVKAGLFDTMMKSVKEYETLSINNGAVIYKKNNIPSGSYIISFKFFKEDNSEIKPGYNEFVQIKTDCISTAERTLKNLEKYHTITYNLNYGEFQMETFPASFNEQQSVLLPTANDVSKDGYKLADWYENEDFWEMS